jgi:hypothetical protein
VVPTIPASGVHSTKEPKSLPLSLEHSRTKAAELRSGHSSFMYEPSVTATQELSAIEGDIQSRSPMMDRLSHNPGVASASDDLPE